MLPPDHPVQLIDRHGARIVDPAVSMPDDALLLAGYTELVRGRRLDRQCGALVRQGRLAVYPSSHGQEACQVAAAMVLGDRDWLFPTYRDSVALFARGIDPVEVLTLLRGDAHCGYDPAAWRVAPQCTPLATQLPHAAGLAHAARLRGEDTVALALCGDGATSEGDFHEALNFAAVFRAPVVFLVQNNGYAISVPLARQTAAPSLAHKAIGYGMPGERVDGNDLAAVLAVLSRAMQRARGGGGPTLVEAHTYRMQAHTNADDATRYRSEDEVSAWIDRDPLTRLETYLRAVGVLDDAATAEAVRLAEAAAAALRDGLGPGDDADPLDLFAHVFAERPPGLAQQAALLRAELGAAS